MIRHLGNFDTRSIQAPTVDSSIGWHGTPAPESTPIVSSRAASLRRDAAKTLRQNIRAAGSQAQHCEDVNAVDHEGRTLLQRAVANGDVEISQALLQRGAHVNAAGRNGMTALHLAARLPATELARALLEAGANVHAADPFGRTALHFAASTGSVDLVETLLAHGAQAKTKKDDFDNTPMTIAKANGSADVAAALRKARAQQSRWKCFQAPPDGS